jgi:hypothetical protein
LLAEIERYETSERPKFNVPFRQLFVASD